MERPEKPNLETRERRGNFGETVVELTPESEAIWSEYLRNINLHRMFMGNVALENAENSLQDEQVRV